MIYLLLKTHTKTGLKYLCKHTGSEESCFKYLGSGLYWKRHLAKHGKDVYTKILGKFNTIEEFKLIALFLSAVWNINENPDWANFCYEGGTGGHYSIEVTQKAIQNRTKRQQLFGFTKKRNL